MIGNDVNHFHGNVEGNCHIITVNLFLPAVFQNVGLFSVLGGNGSISHLRIAGNVTGFGQNTGALVGQVVGFNTLSHITNYATVTGGQNVGGVAGAIISHGVVHLNCVSNTATVTGMEAIGGVVGYANVKEAIFTAGCKNSGTVKSFPHFNPQFMAGIIGYVGSYLIHSERNINIGKIFSRNSYFAGGIFACIRAHAQDNGWLETSINAGIVDGARGYVGGIAGYTLNLHINSCINTNWVDSGTANFFGSIVGLPVNNLNLIWNCFYDEQMSIIGGINNTFFANQAEGLSTAEMTNGNPLPLLGCWIYNPGLYPMHCQGANVVPIKLLAAAPIFIQQPGQNVTGVSNPLNVSINGPGGPYLWGSFVGVGIHLPISVNGNIIDINVAGMGETDIISEGQDSLVVRLHPDFWGLIGQCMVPDNIVIEKYVPVYTLMMQPRQVNWIMRHRNLPECITSCDPVSFLIEFDTPQFQPLNLQASDFDISGISIHCIIEVRPFHLLIQNHYIVTVNPCCFPDAGMNQPDTIKILNINGFTINQNTIPNEFYVVKRRFLTKAELIFPECGWEYAPLAGEGIIELDAPVYPAPAPNEIRILLLGDNGDEVTVIGTLEQPLPSTRITFDYEDLEPDTWYTVYILPNSLIEDDECSNENELIELCRFKTIGKPCIASIVRYSPLANPDGKTNKRFVTFEVTFSAPVSVVNANDFDVSNGTVFGDPAVVANSNSTKWHVTVHTVNNTTNMNDVLVQITGVTVSANFDFCYPDIDNEHYNVRHAFLDIPKYVVRYDDPVNAAPGPGFVRILFEEPLGGNYGENGDYYVQNNFIGGPNNGIYDYIDIPQYCSFYNKDFYYLELHFAWVSDPQTSFPFYVFFNAPHNKVQDEWGNWFTLNFGEISRSVTWKQVFELATAGYGKPFEVSSIRPMPVIDDANLTISTYQEGNLTVGLYNLAGSKISTLLNTYATPNGRYDLNMQLGNLANGAYTLIITLDGFTEMRSILINR